MQTAAAFEGLTRAGFAARGVMYVLIGALTLFSGRSEDGAGALRFLESGGGKFVLFAMALGFLGYAAWRLTEAALDGEGHGTDAKGIAVRAGGVGSGVIHIGLAIVAAKLALSSGGGGSSGSGAAEDGASAALSLPGGWIALVAAAAVLVAVGAYQLIKAVRANFMHNLPTAPGSVCWLGRCGYAARGIVFLVMAWFFWEAGQQTRASAAGGMDEAISALPETLRLAVGGGLLLFGLFSFVEARYRRIRNEDLLRRLKRAAT